LSTQHKIPFNDASAYFSYLSLLKYIYPR